MSATPSRQSSGETQRTPSSKSKSRGKRTEGASERNGLFVRKDGSTNWTTVLLVGSTVVTLGAWWFVTFRKNSSERDQRRRLKIMRDNLDQIVSPPGGIQRMNSRNPGPSM